MLTACMMVRRLKKDVLSQLPPKRRTQVTPPADHHVHACCSILGTALERAVRWAQTDVHAEGCS